ncbi:MAG: response regulator [Myxococcota bacterium]
MLFVDDEVDVLEGLQNRLRSLRTRWRMSFAEGGVQALEQMSAQFFDVIVTDMRMSGMDGAELLSRVQAQFPHTVRIVLSGQTEKEQLLRCLPYAHQFLSKPCEAELIERAVQRSLTLQGTLTDEEIRARIAGIDRLPPLPRLYLELTRILARPEPSLDAIAAKIEEDPSMSARILQIVNSAFFGLARGMNSTRDAVLHLGLNTVCSLVLSTALFDALDHGLTSKEFSLANLQAHSLRVAQVASRLLTDSEEAKAAFSAAMLQDIGSLIVATTLPEVYEQSLDIARSENISSYEAEMKGYGVTHAEIGGALLALWGLPHPIVEAVTFYHQPHRSEEMRFSVVGAVHVADRLVSEDARFQNLGEQALRSSAFDTEYIERVETSDRIERWRMQAAAGALSKVCADGGALGIESSAEALEPLRSMKVGQVDHE